MQAPRFPRSSLVRPLAGAVVAAFPLGGAAFVNRHLATAAREETAAAVRHATELAQTRLRDAVAAELESLRLTAHNAASNPRLLAAVKGRVDRRTFEDLFTTEPWWRPFRTEIAAAIAYAGTDAPVYDQGLAAAGIPIAAVVSKIDEGVASAQIVRARDSLFAVAASAVGQGTTGGYLAIARAFAGPVLDRLAARAGGPVVVRGDELAVASVAAAPDAARPLVPPVIVWAAGAALASAAIAASLRRRSRSPQPLPAAPDNRVLAPIEDGSSAPRRRLSAAFAASLPDRLASPLLGRYALVERIGEGGMAEIYSAVSFGTGGFRRPFVIKRLRPEMTGNQQAVAHFIDEANLGASLSHPNIVPVFDFGESEGECFMVQEYVHGRDLGRLSRRLEQRGEPPPSAAAVLHVAHQVLRALEYAHARRSDGGEPLGIVHRDVTPENVIVSAEGEVKLLDFGIVKADQGRVTRTDLGLVKGNVDFMSPEQARGRAVDGRSDLFSLGLLLYALLTRTPLYAGGTVYERLTKAATGPGPGELAAIAALPKPFDELLGRALEVEPERRFANAAELREAVELLQAELGVDAHQGARELAGALDRAFGAELRREYELLMSVGGPPSGTPIAGVPVDVTRASS